MKQDILTGVALRYNAVYLDIKREQIDWSSEMSPVVAAFVRRLRENGFSITEELLHALNGVEAETLADITLVVDKVLGVDLNWAPLVKGWQVPTGESRLDHIITFFANIDDRHLGMQGDTLPCGHFIPEGTFPLERYNGCPFCGKPFKTAGYVYKGQESKLKQLRLFCEDDMLAVFRSLLESSTPLDATQQESLRQLLYVYGLPDGVSIEMKETAMIAVKTLTANGKDDEAGKLMKTPADILRFLWYEKTGMVKIIEPKTLIKHARRLNSHICDVEDKSESAAATMKDNLKLKYGRKDCQRVARWLNGLHLSAKQACENMNPKRGMWVRMIHALRLGEYSRRKGYEHLAEILDLFYKHTYTTWQGQLENARYHRDADTLLAMLQERPGLFARSLFATMLRFGADKTLDAFRQVADRLPSRLLLSLGNAADNYFDAKQVRLAKPIIGGTVQVPAHKLLALYNKEELAEMVRKVNDIYRQTMLRRFAAMPAPGKTVYIDSQLFNIPVSVGDRSTTIQDTSCALMGTRFPVEGDAVRLFLQWGKGLPAQHMDMDLSCRIALPEEKVEECAYFNLTCTGAKHSGDVRSIPDMVGTAEYIELSIPDLQKAGAKYVTFTCNAYSRGALTPNLVVGWMDSAFPMKVSEEDGVAYDPSCVQHAVRISESNLSKGLVFGVLDVGKREIIWLEMPFTRQTVKGLSSSSVEALLKQLQGKLSVGELLKMKAEAQQMSIVPSPDGADECYTYEWALNAAEVSRLLSFSK